MQKYGKHPEKKLSHDGIHCICTLVCSQVTTRHTTRVMSKKQKHITTRVENSLKSIHIITKLTELSEISKCMTELREISKCKHAWVFNNALLLLRAFISNDLVGVW